MSYFVTGYGSTGRKATFLTGTFSSVQTAFDALQDGIICEVGYFIFSTSSEVRSKRASDHALSVIRAADSLSDVKMSSSTM